METPVKYTETFQEEEEEEEEEKEEEEEEEDSTDGEIDWLIEYIYDDDDDFTEDSSEEPEYRPPHAGGNNSSSSDEDSELECPPIHFQVEESDCDESLDWADHEDNITTIVKQTPTTPPIENKFIASGSCATPFSGYQRCVGCKYWFKQTTLYCNSCWKMKKDWLPDPPPPKSKLSRSKIKTARQKRTKQRGNRSDDDDDTLSRSNETEDPISAPRITLCMLCCTNPRNASLIHGQIGHQLCCYPCAKKLWKEQARCPVCRRKVEKVVKLIQN